MESSFDLIELAKSAPFSGKITCEGQPRIENQKIELDNENKRVKISYEVRFIQRT